MTASAMSETLRIMPREMRMMTERVLSLTAMPKGFFMVLQDAAMFSQALGLGGFAMLESRFDLLRQADPSRIGIQAEAGARLRLDAGGQHAWLVVPTLVDLLGELADRFGEATVTVVGAIDPEELRIVAPLAARAGLAVRWDGDGEPSLSGVRVAPTGDLARDEPLLWSLLQDGTPIDADLWWRIYHLAQKALAPDTVVSRRHAGPMIVNEDGTVIGRRDNDDETDIGFLASAGAASNGTEDARS